MLIYLLAFILLILLNAFFVFAEFASVKIRGSQVEELIDQQRHGAKLVQHIHAHLDEYLSVCQVGITFASIALGFIGERMAVEFIAPHFVSFGGNVAAHAAATTMSVVMVSYVHILLGEQVPKLVAIRKATRAALWSAVPLHAARVLFVIPLWVLNGSSGLILKAMGMGEMPKHDHVSEDELRIILERSQSTGLMSFRRLLITENVFDLGELRVKDAMRPRSQAVCLDSGMSWKEVDAVVGKHRLSRYPLLCAGDDRPAGFVHVKDLLMQTRIGGAPDFSRITRMPVMTAESTPLEELLTRMQQGRDHLAVVARDGAWLGIITMEDIIEEIIGTVGDEFEVEPAVMLGDVLTRSRVVLGVEGLSIVDTVRKALMRVARVDLPVAADVIMRAVSERERVASTYLGQGIAIPHARLSEVAKPALVVIRSEKGIPVESTQERARLLFLLVTPTGQPRVHQKLLARVAALLEKSDYVEERLYKAQTADEMYDIICTGEQTSID